MSKHQIVLEIELDNTCESESDKTRALAEMAERAVDSLREDFEAGAELEGEPKRGWGGYEGPFVTDISATWKGPVTDQWELTHTEPDDYADWVQEVRNGDTVRGFVDWRNAQGSDS